MIPGPIEFDKDVINELGKPTVSHVAPGFIENFGASIEMIRQVWESPGGQPFIIAGTGTLAMDVAGSNLVENGDNVLVISTGYFGERYADLLGRYGANVDILRADLGNVVPEEEIEEQLKNKDYKLMTFTHVDTSTAVRVDPEPLGKLGNKYGVLTILDGVCSVAGEEIRQDKWGIDIVLTASQKAIGVPPGLALLVASQKAIKTWQNRRTPVGNYYADWNNWLPIMEAYEARKPSYFGTPAVNLVNALKVSLGQIIEDGNDKRFLRHRLIGEAFRSAMEAIGLGMVPLRNDIAANTLSAPYYPDGVNGQDLLAEINKAGVVLAGGLHPEIKTKYFRVGHMGSVSGKDHLLQTIAAIEKGLKECKYAFNEGSAIEAAANVLNKN